VPNWSNTTTTQTPACGVSVTSTGTTANITWNVCDTGQGLCGGVCTNLNTSKNCGACGETCTYTDSCLLYNGHYQCICTRRPCN
jgi:hypothetical protein